MVKRLAARATRGPDATGLGCSSRWRIAAWRQHTFGRSQHDCRRYARGRVVAEVSQPASEAATLHREDHGAVPLSAQYYGLLFVFEGYKYQEGYKAECTCAKASAIEPIQEHFKGVFGQTGVSRSAAGAFDRSTRARNLLREAGPGAGTLTAQ